MAKSKSTTEKGSGRGGARGRGRGRGRQVGSRRASSEESEEVVANAGRSTNNTPRTQPKRNAKRNPAYQDPETDVEEPHTQTEDDEPVANGAGNCQGSGEPNCSAPANGSAPENQMTSEQWNTRFAQSEEGQRQLARRLRADKEREQEARKRVKENDRRKAEREEKEREEEKERKKKLFVVDNVQLPYTEDELKELFNNSKKSREEEQRKNILTGEVVQPEKKSEKPDQELKEFIQNFVKRFLFERGEQAKKQQNSDDKEESWCASPPGEEEEEDNDLEEIPAPAEARSSESRRCSTSGIEEMPRRASIKRPSSQRSTHSIGSAAPKRRRGSRVLSEEPDVELEDGQQNEARGESRQSRASNSQNRSSRNRGSHTPDRLSSGTRRQGENRNGSRMERSDSEPEEGQEDSARLENVITPRRASSSHSRASRNRGSDTPDQMSVRSSGRRRQSRNGSRMEEPVVELEDGQENAARGESRQSRASKSQSRASRNRENDTPDGAPRTSSGRRSQGGSRNESRMEQSDSELGEVEKVAVRQENGRTPRRPSTSHSRRQRSRGSGTPDRASRTSSGRSRRRGSHSGSQNVPEDTPYEGDTEDQGELIQEEHPTFKWPFDGPLRQDETDYEEFGVPVVAMEEEVETYVGEVDYNRPGCAPKAPWATPKGRAEWWAKHGYPPPAALEATPPTEEQPSSTSRPRRSRQLKKKEDPARHSPGESHALLRESMQLDEAMKTNLAATKDYLDGRIVAENNPRFSSTSSKSSSSPSSSQNPAQNEQQQHHSPPQASPPPLPVAVPPPPPAADRNSSVEELESQENWDQDMNQRPPLPPVADHVPSVEELEPQDNLDQELNQEPIPPPQQARVSAPRTPRRREMKVEHLLDQPQAPAPPQNQPISVARSIKVEEPDPVPLDPRDKDVQRIAAPGYKTKDLLLPDSGNKDWSEWTTEELVNWIGKVLRRSKKVEEFCQRIAAEEYLGHGFFALIHQATSPVWFGTPGGWLCELQTRAKVVQLHWEYCTLQKRRDKRRS